MPVFFYTTKKPSNAAEPKLSATNSNNLIVSLLVAKGYKTTYGFIKTVGKRKARTDYLEVSQNGELQNAERIFVSKVTRDNTTGAGTSSSLAFINDFIKQFFKEKVNLQKAKLLIPMAQYRLFKRHNVLVEVKLEGGKKSIIIHDSQKKGFFDALYPNALKSLKKIEGFKDISVDTKYYAQQNDRVSCGIFVYKYIKSILGIGNHAALGKIKVEKNARNRGLFSLEKTLSANLRSVMPKAGAITPEGGQPLEWNICALKRQLRPEYEKETLKIKIDFDEDDDPQADIETVAAGSSRQDVCHANQPINTSNGVNFRHSLLFPSVNKKVETQENQSTSWRRYRLWNK